MTTQATPLWSEERIEARCDALTPGEADMGEMEYWNTLRDLALRVGIEVRDEYESALDQVVRESNMIFDRGAQRLAQLKTCQSELSLCRKQYDEILSDLNVAMTALAARDAEIASLKAQLAEANRWEDVPDGIHTFDDVAGNEYGDGVSIIGKTVCIERGYGRDTEINFPDNWRLQRKRGDE